jgi:TonB family protein
MKTLSAFFLLAVTSVGCFAAESPAPALPDGLQPLKLIQGNPPIFPPEMVQQGVREGEARVAFSVDVTGKVDDCLPVAYTNSEFARVSVAALKRWKFEPARYHGEPVAAVSDLVVRFEMEGTVIVSLNSAESIGVMMRSMVHEDEFRPRSLKELDRIPTPVNAPAPAFPPRLARRGATQQVTVSFYIDPTGAVRLASVNAADDPILGGFAIEAMRNWKFEPPTWKGHPVLVRASQRFNFRAPEAATAAKGTSG